MGAWEGLPLSAEPKSQPNAFDEKTLRLRRAATYASVAVSILLILVKLGAFVLTDSIAMLSSLLDSTTDLMTALITMFSVASALKPPDSDHRYGHGKAEPLAALAQAAFIAGSSVLLVYEAASRFYHPHEIQYQALGFGVMAFAIVITLALLEFQRYVLRRAKSMAIGADRLHYLGDLLINVAVAAAFGLYMLTGLAWFDPVFTLLIAAGMVYSARHIAAHALNALMDRELPDEDREKIQSIVRAQPNVRGLHDLRTRTDGERAFIEFHLELDPDMTLRAAHRVDESIMAALHKAFPRADIAIHQDPDGIEETRLDEKIAREEIKAANK